MTTRVVRSLGSGLIVICVAVASVLCFASAALANSCPVTGTFMLTTTDSSGRLFLRADGHAGMIRFSRDGQRVSTICAGIS